MGVCYICGKPISKNRKLCIECVTEKKEYTCEVCAKTYSMTNLRVKRRGSTNICTSCLAKRTFTKHYGVENPAQADEIKEKQRATNLKRRGVEYPKQSSEVEEKYKLTMLERYGVDHNTKTSSFWDKYRQTCNAKYGVDYYSQSKDAATHRKSLIEYDDISFDSTPEVEFYKKCKELGFSIQRNPCVLEYEYNDEKHYYHPDFRVNNRLVEIKGAYFRGSDNTWRCPFDKHLDELYKAKYNCAIANNVTIIYDNELASFEYSIFREKI